MNTPSLCKKSMLAAAVGGLVLSCGAFANDNGGKMQMMDTNGDGKISAAEHEAGARKMFEKMDANHDGKVTAAEMEAAHKNMGAMKDPDSARPMMSSAEKIKTIDSDGDGVITAEEHAAGARSMFEKMDTDKDGYLTPAEMQAGHDRMMSSGKKSY